MNAKRLKIKFSYFLWLFLRFSLSRSRERDLYFLWDDADFVSDDLLYSPPTAPLVPLLFLPLDLL